MTDDEILKRRWREFVFAAALVVLGAGGALVYELVSGNNPMAIAVLLYILGVAILLFALGRLLYRFLSGHSADRRP